MSGMELREMRRLDLIDLRESLGRGALKKMQEATGIEASYLSRCCYEEGKKEKRNIGDKVLTPMDKAYPGWRKRESEAISAETLTESLHSDSKEVFISKATKAISAAEDSGKYATADTKQGREVMERFDRLESAAKLELLKYLDYLEH